MCGWRLVKQPLSHTYINVYASHCRQSCPCRYSTSKSSAYLTLTAAAQQGQGHLWDVITTPFSLRMGRKGGAFYNKLNESHKKNNWDGFIHHTAHSPVLVFLPLKWASTRHWVGLNKHCFCPGQHKRIQERKSRQRVVTTERFSSFGDLNIPNTLQSKQILVQITPLLPWLCFIVWFLMKGGYHLVSCLPI